MFTPLICLSILFVLLLALLAYVHFSPKFHNDRTARGELRVVEFNGDAKVIKNIFKTFTPTAGYPLLLIGSAFKIMVERHKSTHS